MRSVSRQVVCLSRRCVAVSPSRRGSRRQKPAAPVDQRSARRTEAGPARCRRGRPQHGAGLEPAASRKASSIRRRRPAIRRRQNRRRREPRRSGRAGRRRRPAERTPPGRRPLPRPRGRTPATPPAGGAGRRRRLGFANSDLAFSGNHLFVGNFHGFNTYDIERPNRPKLLASVVCPGGQGDVSVHGNLLFMSVEQTRGRSTAARRACRDRSSAERFRGVRIFDITRREASRSRSRRSRPAAGRTRTRWCTDPQRQGEPLRLRLGHGRGAVRRGARRLLRRSIPRRIRTRRSSAST